LNENNEPLAIRNAFPNDNPQEKPKSNEWIGRIESAHQRRTTVENKGYGLLETLFKQIQQQCHDGKI